MFESKYSKVLTVILVIVIIAIISLLGFLAFDYIQKINITNYVTETYIFISFYDLNHGF